MQLNVDPPGLALQHLYVEQVHGEISLISRAPKIAELDSHHLLIGDRFSE